MNRLNLRQRLLLLTLLPSTLIAVVLVAYFTFSGIKTLEGELRQKALATVRYLAPVSEYGIIAGQLESLHALAQATVQESGVKAAVIVSPKGRTLAVSGRVSLAAENLRQILPAPGLVAETEQWVAFAAPVKRSMTEADLLFEPPNGQSPAPEIVGQVFVEFDKNELVKQQHHLLQRGLLIVFGGLLLLAGLAIAMADNLAKPVLRLVRAIGNMSAGRFEIRVPTTTSGEIGVLEHGFNEMAAHLEEMHRSMQVRIEEATAQLAFQARHDPLTGLINRREFEHRLNKAVAAVQAGGEEFTVLFLDLDRFKQVNDSCGYLAGDDLLRQMAQLFAGRLREQDTLARLGGDEFAIILHNCTGRFALQVAQDICSLAAAYRFIFQDKVFAIGTSVGVTTVTAKVRHINEILSAGDAACHTAKASGRNQVRVQAITATADRRQESSHWASRLASALADDHLQIEAMPLVALQTKGHRHIAELTARLHEPGEASVGLAALIDAAERYELATAIDQRLLDAALDALARARQQQRSLYCLVPLSRSSIANPETVDYIARGLASRNLSGERLCCLFSEDILTYLVNQSVDFCRRLHQLGCQVGLADFGGGLSSFSQLRQIQPHYVRINPSLTRDLADSRESLAVLRAVQEITADQNIRTIAEDVDNREQLNQLRQLGIDYAQGKAAALNEPLEAWLEGAVIRSAE